MTCCDSNRELKTGLIKVFFTPLSSVEVMSGLCKSIVDLSEEILLACLIERGEITDYYARKGVPVLNETRSSIMLTQTRLIMSMVLEAQVYMGKLQFTHFHR